MLVTAPSLCPHFTVRLVRLRPGAVTGTIAADTSDGGAWWRLTEPAGAVSPVEGGDWFVSGRGSTLIGGAGDVDIASRGMAAAFGFCERTIAGRLDPAPAKEPFRLITVGRVRGRRPVR